MRRVALTLGLAGLLALGVSSAAVAGPYDFASGAGTAGVKFDFTAHNNAQGLPDTLCPITITFGTAPCPEGTSIVGQMHITDSSGHSGVADVTCLSVDVTGTQADILGQITRGDSPFTPGSFLEFRAGDNDGTQEGQGPPDTLETGLTSAPPPPEFGCTGLVVQPGTPLTSGNIVVRKGTS